MLVPCGHVKSTGWPWGKTGQPTTPVRAGVVRMGQGLGLFLTSNLRCRRSAEPGPLSGADPTCPGQEGEAEEGLGDDRVAGAHCRVTPASWACRSATVHLSRSAAASSGSPDPAPDPTRLTQPPGNVLTAVHSVNSTPTRISLEHT